MTRFQNKESFFISATLRLCALLMLIPFVAYAAEPTVAIGETRRLEFQVLPTETEGDVKEQIQAGLKRVQLPIVHLRIFVVGSFQLGHARETVEAIFKSRRQPLPALTIVGVGALPQPNAKVSMEVVLTGKANSNPNGLAFASGMAGSDPNPAARLFPLAEKAVRDLNSLHKTAAVESSDVLRVTCLMSGLNDISAIQSHFKTSFPKASLNFVQLQRTAKSAVIECESVSRLRQAQPEPFRWLMSEDIPKSPNFSHVALLSTSQLAFTGLELAIGDDEAASRAAFAKLAERLESVGASIKQVAMSSLYPTSQSAADIIRKTRFDFYDRAHPPASTMLLFETLPYASSIAVDAVAPIPNKKK